MFDKSIECSLVAIDICLLVDALRKTSIFWSFGIFMSECVRFSMRAGFLILARVLLFLIIFVGSYWIFDRRMGDRGRAVL